MLKKINELIKDEEGATAVEYGLIVAAIAAVLEGGVDVGALEGLTVVTLEAGLRPLRAQQVATLGAVRVVTGRALPALEAGVDVGPVQADLFLAVTGETELIAVFLEQQLRDDAVSEVALLAVPGLHAGMQVLQTENLFREVLVAVRAFLRFEFLLLRECDIAERGEHGYTDREEEQANENLPMSVHISPAASAVSGSISPLSC